MKLNTMHNKNLLAREDTGARSRINAKILYFFNLYSYNSRFSRAKLLFFHFCRIIWKLRIVLCLLLFFILTSALSAQTYTVSGYVIDNETGETIIGVNVVVRDLQKGASTDGNGYFRITGLAPGKYIVDVLHIAYAKTEVEIAIGNKNIVLDDIPIEPTAVQLQEIVVAGKRSEIADIEMETSHREITPRAIRSIPTSRGDVFRALKYLPGVEAVDPFSPLYVVRGGDTGENLVLLDGVTIYNPYHFVSSTGLFNLYAIKNVELLVGGFGAEYGGRNSSVLYITTREGNSKKLHGELQPTTTHTKAVFDFPVGKNATMMVSGRFYYDLISRFLFYLPNYFYDANISFNWKLNRQNRLSLRYFFSKDFLDYSFARFSSYFATSFDTDIFDDYDVIYNTIWNNRAATATLKTVINPKIYMQTQLSGSFFSSNNISALDFEYTDPEDNEMIKLFTRTDIRNNISDLSGKSTLSIKLNSANTFKFGGEFSRYSFSNDVLFNNLGVGKVTRKPVLSAGFAEDKITLGRLSLRPGIRFTNFSFANKPYSEPRVNGVLNLPRHMKLKAAWGKYYQYIISINAQEYEISQYLDYYYPLEKREPGESTHYILGLEKALTENSQASVDLYYKDISRTYTFDFNVSELEIYRFSDKLREGSGESYGMEFLWKGNWKTFSGWLSYGISKATRSYPHIMNGKTFLFDYDRTHSFKAVINHQVLPALSYSGTLRIMSGIPKTLETSYKSYFYYDPQTNEYAVSPTYVTDIKNDIRLPLFVRLDLGLQKRIRKGFAAELGEFLGAKESYLNFAFGNVLFLLRRNVWFYIPTGEEKLYGVGSNYIPEISLGYTIKF